MLALSCEKNCHRTYKVKTANMTAHHKIYGSKWKFVNYSFIPTCSPCPAGASCESLFNSLPNYWGFSNMQRNVTMIRCPADHCCKDKTTCEGIDSCNTGRTGTLCGTCQSNLTESLFSAKSLHVENCFEAFVVFASSSSLSWSIHKLLLYLINNNGTAGILYIINNTVFIAEVTVLCLFLQSKAVASLSRVIVVHLQMLRICHLGFSPLLSLRVSLLFQCI